MSKKTKNTLPNKVDLYYHAKEVIIKKYFDGVEPLKETHIEFVNRYASAFVDGAEYIKSLI